MRRRDIQGAMTVLDISLVPANISEPAWTGWLASLPPISTVARNSHEVCLVPEQVRHAVRHAASSYGTNSRKVAGRAPARPTTDSYEKKELSFETASRYL